MTDGEEEEEGISWINAALPKPNAINKCDAVFFVAMGKLILEWDEHNFILKDLVIFKIFIEARIYLKQLRLREVGASF